MISHRGFVNVLDFQLFKGDRATLRYGAPTNTDTHITLENREPLAG